MAEGQISLEEADARSKIGRRIVYWALSAVTLLGTVAMFIGGERATQVKDILAMLLPMIGAWVGTVLAFYFGKENYVAAAENSKQNYAAAAENSKQNYAAAAQNSRDVIGMTLDQRLQSTGVESVMIELGQAENKLPLQASEDQMLLKTDVLDQTVNKTGRNRILIFDQSGVVKYVIHRSVLDKFISDQAFSGKKVSDLSLQHFLDVPGNREWATSFAVIGSDKKLSDVKALFDPIGTKCSDVIITADGGRASKAIGWITNAIVLEKSRA
jgi:hypothetical protein